MQTLTIDVHSSVGEEALQQAAIESLQANRIDPKALYITPHQAELWRQVSLHHSPLGKNPEFVRIYREAFARICDEKVAAKVFLIGLGCGTGAKELELLTSLKSRGKEALFAALDVSRGLVEESAQRLIAAGAEHQRSLVCDLVQGEFMTDWLDRVNRDLPRLITFFGLVPNFAPSTIIPLFRAILRPGDTLLVSAHLAPVLRDNPDERAGAMNTVLTQYDNPETLAWLAAAVEYWRLEDRVASPQMSIGEIGGIPAFIARSKWKTNEPFEKWGHYFSPKMEEPLQLFYSLRYTPALFENLLHQAGFQVERLATTACLQEAIWSVRRTG